MPHSWHHPQFGVRALEWLVARRPGNLLLLVILLVPVGTVGYVLVEGLGVLDAVYQTMITLSTVGYQDLVTSTGGRIFTILFMAFGVGLFVITLSSLAAFLVEGRLREAIGRHRMEREIRDLRDHVIVCGYGRFGETAANELEERGVKFALIEQDAAKVSAAEELGRPAILADATLETSLRRAGVEHARGIIATLDSDAMNVYVALTAKQVRPDIQIVAVARGLQAESKLRAAGADHVLSPYLIGGQNLVRRMLQPHVSDFLDGTRGVQVRMEEVTLRTGSPLVNLRLKDTNLRQKYGITIVAVWKSRTGEVNYHPEADLQLEAGDVMVAVGSPEGLKAAEADCATKT